MAAPMDIVVIGGSIAGLMHALVLKSHGHRVQLLELRSAEQLRTRAAGLSLWPHAQKLIKTYAPGVDLERIAIRNQTMEVMTGDGFMLAETPVFDDIRTSSWGSVQRVLTEACEKKSTEDGSVTFHYGAQVSAVTANNNTITVTYGCADKRERQITADLLVSADGARSFVRRLLLPDVVPEYAGYLAWRGVVPRGRVYDAIKGTMTGKLSLFLFDGSYVIVCLTPGSDGVIAPSEDLLEWCWFDPCPSTSSAYTDLLIDKHGRKHNRTVPAHLLRPELWKLHLIRRKSTISPLWYSIFSDSAPPLLSAVHSFSNSKASFYDNKLLLVGEAFMQIRPHLGASCDIAALQALTLVDALDGKISWEEWESEVSEYAEEKAVGSVATGTFGLTGRWPEGYVPSFTESGNN